MRVPLSAVCGLVWGWWNNICDTANSLGKHSTLSTSCEPCEPIFARLARFKILNEQGQADLNTYDLCQRWSLWHSRWQWGAFRTSPCRHTGICSGSSKMYAWCLPRWLMRDSSLIFWAIRQWWHVIRISHSQHQVFAPRWREVSIDYPRTLRDSIETYLNLQIGGLLLKDVWFSIEFDLHFKQAQQVHTQTAAPTLLSPSSHFTPPREPEP